MNKQWREYSFFNSGTGEKLNNYMFKKNEIRIVLTLYININSKWAKEPNIWLEAIKLIEENIDKMLFYINYSNIVLNLSPKTKETKLKNKQMESSWTWKLFHSKGSH